MMGDRASIREIVEKTFREFEQSNANRIRELGYPLNYRLIVADEEYVPRFCDPDDPQIITTAVHEMISNAFKAIVAKLESSGKKQIDTTLLNDHISDIAVSLSTENGYYLVSVSDNGPGIRRRDRRKIFKPGKSTNRTLGMGLPTVRDIAKRLCGRLEFDSIYRIGTVFRLYIPITYEAPENCV